MNHMNRVYKIYTAAQVDEQFTIYGVPVVSTTRDDAVITITLKNGQVLSHDSHDEINGCIDTQGKMVTVYDEGTAQEVIAVIEKYMFLEARLIFEQTDKDGYTYEKAGRVARAHDGGDSIPLVYPSKRVGYAHFIHTNRITKISLARGKEVLYEKES